MKDIHIEDIGPVEEFSYSMAGPGLHILRGEQGAGKTTILRTVQLAADGHTAVKPQRRDGTKKGIAEVAGKTLKIARVTRTEGEIDLEGLGDLDISVLHFPKYKNAVTRDAYRIKAMLRLMGADANPAMFHDIVGGKEEFKKLVDADACDSDDLVELSAKVKRQFEKHAVDAEKRAETERTWARSKFDVSGDLDGLEFNESAASEAQRLAIQKASETDERYRQGLVYQADLKQATEKLSECGEVDIEDLQHSLTEQEELLERRKVELKRAEEVLQQKRELVAGSEGAVTLASERVEAGVKAAAYQQVLKDRIETCKGYDAPTGEDLQAARDAEKSAMEEYAEQVALGNRLAAKADGEAHLAAAKDEERVARKYRGYASAVAEVLAEQVAHVDGALFVKFDEDCNPRLALATDRSDGEYFDELSDGERWTHVMSMCAKPNRIIVLPQDAYGELQPSNQKLLDEMARKYGCYILTAEADDCGLHGVAFGAVGEVSEEVDEEIEGLVESVTLE